MAWNYRVVRVGSGDEAQYGLHEVYYDEEGRPEKRTVEPADVVAESLEDLHWMLDRMHEALAKAVLTGADFGEG